ncbi:MAG TPA: hypothetical protein PKI22_09560 [Hydrogenophilus thermoluteolus]|nr:hypothetical protein [Hydrogenophilus thermoluteolus]
MSLQKIYVRREQLTERLTVGLLRRYIPADKPLLISLEPRAWLPSRHGRYLCGRLPGLEPLTQTLPEAFDDLPLLTASLYADDHWQHFHDAHPLSQTKGLRILWSLSPTTDGKELEVQVKQQTVLTWQDRHRFGLPTSTSLPASLQTEHYYQKGKRLAWRLIPPKAEVDK